MTLFLVEPSKGKACSWKSPTEGTKLPYDFVPVVPEDIKAEEPVWHDGSHNGAEELYSGELWCTLTTLTPTVVGNQQFELSEAGEGARGALSQYARREGIEQALLDANYLKKKCLTPLRAPFLPCAPILIAGESIAGMVRHSIGALMNAPLERVQPGNFSYRPNSAIQHGRPSLQMAGMVEEVDLTNLTLKVRLFSVSDVLFIHASRQELSALISPDATYPVKFEARTNFGGWIWAAGGERTFIEKGRSHHYFWLPD